MEYKLIQGNNYLLIVDDNLTDNSWALLPNGKLAKMNPTDFVHYLDSNSNATKNVIAHLPLSSNAPVLEGVDLLPELIPYKLRLEAATFAHDYCDEKGFTDTRDRILVIAAATTAYKAATKRYSEEDLKKVFDVGIFLYPEDNAKKLQDAFFNTLQSINNAALPVGFKLSNTFPNKASKTFLKSDYKTFEVDVWQGEYIY